MLSVDDQPRTSTRITPLRDAPDGRSFRLDTTGSEIVLRFRPRFYQKHRGLRFFEPWTYDIWPTPVVGWTSWFAFFDKVTEHDVRHTADVLSDVLRPFGYDYLQIDDGYQRGTGLPAFWLEPNEKFPSGLEALAGYIRGKGLKPGIWTNATFSQTEYAEQHADWFVRDTAATWCAATGSTIPSTPRRPVHSTTSCGRSTGRCGAWAGTTSSSMRCGTSGTRATTPPRVPRRAQASTPRSPSGSTSRRFGRNSVAIRSCSRAGACGRN